MQNPQVIHLVSNSFTHPDNTANSFKVSYNVPFDLTDKKVALIEASLTKSNANVLNEAIIVKSHRPPVKKYAGFMTNNVSHIASEDVSSWEKFFQLLATPIKDSDGSTIIHMSSTLRASKKLVRFVINNSSNHKVKIKTSSTLNPHEGWGWQGTNFLFKAYNPVTTSFSVVKQHVEFTLKKI